MTQETSSEIIEDVTERAHRLIAATPLAEAPRLPFDPEAEAAVLSCCLRSSHALSFVLPELRPEHFWAPAHRAIWIALQALTKAGEVGDPVAVRGWLEERNKLAGAGGDAYINRLLEAGAPIEQASAYSARVRRVAQRRAMIQALRRLDAEEQREPSEDFVDRVEREVFSITHATTTRRTPTLVGDAARSLLESMRDDGARAPVVPTGIPALDARIHGLRDQHLVIVGARPAMGKSALLGGFATATARWSCPVTKEVGGALVFSAEMTKEEVAQRMLCAEARVDGSEFSDGRALRSADSLQRLAASASQLQDDAVWIDDTAAPTLEHVRSQIRWTKAAAARMQYPDGWRCRLRVVVVDYLQIMGTRREPGKTREREISELSKGLKDIAKEECVCVVAASQLSRALEARPNKRPVMADLRESGSLEQDADIILMLYRDEYYNPDTAAKNVAEIIVAKRRGGKAGAVRAFARFEGAYTLFSELTDEEQDQLEREAYEESRQPRAPRSAGGRWAAKRSP